MASGIKTGIADSGWIEATLGSNFNLYSSSEPVRYRKIGNIVNIVGTVSPKSALTINADNRFTIMTLPDGFRPKQIVSQICQGSTQYIWLLQISATSGDVRLGRYRMTNASSYTNCPSGAWLPFNVVFEVE